MTRAEQSLERMRQALGEREYQHTKRLLDAVQEAFSRGETTPTPSQPEKRP